MKFQSSVDPIVADEINKFLKHAYADLPGIVEHVKEALSEHQLAYTQGGVPIGDRDYLFTQVMHVPSGEWIRSYFLIDPVERSNPQRQAAAITTLRRYGLVSILGLVVDEDEAVAQQGARAVQKASKPAGGPTPQAEPVKPSTVNTDALMTDEHIELLASEARKANYPDSELMKAARLVVKRKGWKQLSELTVAEGKAIIGHMRRNKLEVDDG
jgi:hypothetical protein